MLPGSCQPNVDKPLVFFPIFAGRAADIGFEYPRKMAGGGKAEIRANRGQRFIRIVEEAFCFLRFFLQDEVSYIFPRYPP